jgi:exodeoxyribonuclease VII large subunit
MRSIGSDPTLSPTDFVAVFNQSLELMYPTVSIVGELAHFKISKGRWVYFDLIDDNASVKFFGTVTMLPGPLEDGLNLEVSGFPRLHPNFGFSVNIMNIQVVGSGSIAKANKLLEKKLSLEGLFDDSRKRELPYPPEKIGLVTSVESAAYSDFMKIIRHRWPISNIIVEDVLVQGNDAPNQITKALDKLNQMPEPPEAMAIIRGGGSADDLAAFSTEQVVRAVASSRIPTIVGVGHESDVSLAENAADKRASTPSNAAELLVPNMKDEEIRLSAYSKSLNSKLEALYFSKKQDITYKKERLDQILNNIFIQSSDKLEKNKLIFKNLSPTAPLSKGFAIVKTREGKIIKSAKTARLQEKMNINFLDGNVNVLKDKS